MALNAYLKLKGQKQGEIKGSVTQKGREDKIMVIAVSHEIISPRDPASGLPTGKRMHKPFVITKELDKSHAAPLQRARQQREHPGVGAPVLDAAAQGATGVGARCSTTR